MDSKKFHNYNVLYTVDGKVLGSETYEYAKPLSLPFKTIINNNPVSFIKAMEGPCELEDDCEEFDREEIKKEVDDILSINDDNDKRNDVDNENIISHKEFATASSESPNRHSVKTLSNPAASEEFRKPLSAEVAEEKFTAEEIGHILVLTKLAEQVKDGVEASKRPGSNRLEMPIQFCSSCNQVNRLLARYCDSCGAKLHKACHLCKGKNLVIANFCQFCGNKFTFKQSSEYPDIEKLSVRSRNKGFVAKPVTVNKGVSCMKHKCASKLVQTDPLGGNFFKILGKPVTEQTSSKTASKYVQTHETFDTSNRKSPNSTPDGKYGGLQVTFSVI